MNFTASFTKPINAVPWKKACVQDRHHELYKTDLKGTVLVYPAVIGSTYTGAVLLELMHSGSSPVAMVVRHADSLMVSGSVLADVWFECGIPVVEFDSEELYDKINNGDRVEVDGDTGEINVL